jgi:nucleoside 2-deoxyribosyltransferase
MKAFLSIKYWGDNRNREHVESVIGALENAGFEVFCFRRDAEVWGKHLFEPQEMMHLTFSEINKADFLVADVGDWPIGVGVEAGYAYSKGVPVICICPMEKALANTVTGLAKKLIKYKDYDDLKSKFISLNLESLFNK